MESNTVLLGIGSFSYWSVDWSPAKKQNETTLCEQKITMTTQHKAIMMHSQGGNPSFSSHVSFDGSDKSLVVSNDTVTRTAITTAGRRRKQVHFDESCNTFHVNNTICLEEQQALKSQCWYSRDDYRRFSSDMQGLIEIFQENDTVSTVLKQIYQTLCRVECEQKSSDELVSENVLDQLIRLYMNETEMLGLESGIVPGVANNMIGRREMLQEQVQQAQMDCCLESDEYDDDDDDLEELMRFCGRVTRPARLLAQVLAHTQLVVQ